MADLSDSEEEALGRTFSEQRRLVSSRVAADGETNTESGPGVTSIAGSHNLDEESAVDNEHADFSDSTRLLPVLSRLLD